MVRYFLVFICIMAFGYGAEPEVSQQEDVSLPTGYVQKTVKEQIDAYRQIYNPISDIREGNFYTVYDQEKILYNLNDLDNVSLIPENFYELDNEGKQTAVAHDYKRFWCDFKKLAEVQDTANFSKQVYSCPLTFDPSP